VAALAGVGLAQQFGQWSDWMGTSASSIQYRWELTGSYEGMVQFRNSSSNAVTIQYAIWVPGRDQAETGTTYAKAEDTSDEVSFVTTNGQPPSRVDVQIK